ncbi:unnamed protein product [Caenorhabditis bovis]|uniref:GRIP domain-containing protein n=1 Tax=Caenorhabditis bovis TaxID=2654633 RepID=A0A8S1EE21_9PELO|nr:unnamed protein product [Caenorhabditis bovis]
MSGWLRNLQGQITDLANEVLNEASEVINEAREEVSDPDTELQVAKKNCAEAEKKLAIENAKVKSLEDENKTLQQQLYDAHVEIDAVSAKFTNMVKQRDDEIKKLKVQIEQINDSGWNQGGDEATSQVIEDLKKELAHWKSLVEEAHKENYVPQSQVERQIEELCAKKEHEVQCLVEAHNEALTELREMYEEKLQALQLCNASSSTSNADTLDAVMLEKDEFTRSKASTNGSENGERPVVVDLGAHDELADERVKQIEAELDRMREEREQLIAERDEVLESLKLQNAELANAYNDLNTEFETYKKENATVQTRNEDLNSRIDSLKASLIEYEERYEMCKRENMETVAQLAKLSEDFDRLRNGIASVSQRRENCDHMVNEEIEKLREALNESRAERERLREDVHRFQEAVEDINSELEKLRDSNHRLLAENQALTANLANYDVTMRDIISASEKDIVDFKEQFKNIRETHSTEREAVLGENSALRSEVESLRKQNEYLHEESKLLREVNEKLKAKSGNDDTRAELLETKINLLEQMRTELSEENENLKRDVQSAKHETAEKQTELETVRKELTDAQTDPDLIEKMNKLNLALDENPAIDHDGLVAKLKSMIANQQAQITELLEANTEKSEECEEVRNEVRNLEKEVEIRQTCVDEMISQTNTLQYQQQTMTTEISELTAKLVAKEQELLKMQQDLAHERDKMEEIAEMDVILDSIIKEAGDDVLPYSTTNLPSISSQQNNPILLLKSRVEIARDIMASQLRELEALKKNEKEEAHIFQPQQSEDVVSWREFEELAAKKEAADSELQRAIEEASANIENLKKASSSQEDAQARQQLSLENEELKKALVAKHEESVEYYNQLQACVTRNQQIEAQFLELSKKCDELNAQLHASVEISEKRAKELERLKEHLMLVEETSTREAVEAEQRETELRARIKALEARGHAAETGASESTQQYQIQIAALTSKLEAVERTSSEWQTKYDSEMKAREQTQEALTSLQNVVRELSIDHERDSAAASHRNLELQSVINGLNNELGELREQFERQQIGRQSAEEYGERLKLQLESKQKIIEDLEIQIEELRAPTSSKSQQQQDSYRIDDATLRQLFLNYFMAEPSKRADIAMLLASILEYPPADMEKVRNAVRQSFGQASSFFGARSSPQPASSSLTEQFIRFLEAESESSKTAPNLPTRSSVEPPQISLRASLSPTPSSNQPASSSSSAAALDSLLR